MSGIRSRSELLAALEADASRLPEVAAAIGKAEFEQGVYENGWSARQLLAHLAAIEWTYPRLIEQARMSVAQRSDSSGGGRFDMDAYNERQVANRAEASIDKLLEEFNRNRRATIEAVGGSEDALLAQAARSAGGVEGTLLEVLASVTVEHVRTHITDLETVAGSA